MIRKSVHNRSTLFGHRVLVRQLNLCPLYVCLNINCIALKCHRCILFLVSRRNSCILTITWLTCREITVHPSQSFLHCSLQGDLIPFPVFRLGSVTSRADFCRLGNMINTSCTCIHDQISPHDVGFELSAHPTSLTIMTVSSSYVATTELDP